MSKKIVFSHDNQHLLSLILCRAKGNVSTELDNETVILDLSSGRYSGLDYVGTTVWKLLEQPISFSHLREKLLEEYEVSKEQCTGDLLVFLQKLVDNNLLMVEHDDAE